ncbi:hypothetical protein [Microbacterium sp. PA5]|uniref:hypothetical protein n=1 Tax=Microbacterium sp. PA5 TaxID=3416654 RepID=UPI003CEF0BE2
MIGSVRRLPVLASALIVMTLSGCAGGGAQLAEYPPGSGGSIALDRTTSDANYSFDDIRMCVEDDGTVTVVDAEPIDPTGGMEITRFAVLPSDADSSGYLEGSDQSLADAGFPVEGPAVVNLRCPVDDAAWSDGEGQAVFGFEVSRADPDAGTMRGVRVTYESHGVTSTIDYPLGIVLCRQLYADADRTVRNEGCDVQTIHLD